MNVQTNNQKGFTIIEVVLVLAIAGLIFLMVFIALPALQRSQRDTQRRSDVGTVVSQLTSYATNNRGALPGNATATNTFRSSYVKELKDPLSGNDYEIIFNKTDQPPTNDYDTIYYGNGVKCDETAASGLETAGAREGAVRITLESGGVFCQDVK
jgi:prepilin-type N-terminal cleavage/methylation domain-containing protein